MRPDPALSRACRYAERTAGRCGEWIEAHTVACWTVFTLLYSVTSIAQAIRRPLWFDEIVTFHVCRLPDLASLWDAVKQGADANPLLFHLISRGAFAAFGENPLAGRATAIAGFWLMSLCLYLFVRRRCGPLWAWVAAILPLVTDAVYYSTEARPYGLVLGFSALALLAWQGTKEYGFRRMSLAGLALALAAAVSCHFYAVFLAVGIGVGELRWTVERKKFDWWSWAALCVGLSPLALMTPVIGAATGYAGDRWSKATLAAVTDSYRNALSGTIKPAVAVLLLVAAIWAIHAERTGNPVETQRNRLPGHEVAAALGLALWPLSAGLFSLLVSGIYVWRYSVPLVIGICVLVAFSLYEKLGRDKALVTLIVALLFVYPFALRVSSLRQPVSSPDWAWISTAAENREAPVAVASAIVYLEADYYATAELRPRLWSVVDPRKALRYTGNRSAEVGVLNLRPWARVQVQHADAFLRRYRSFYLLESPLNPGWLLQELLASGAQVSVRRVHGDNLLCWVTQRPQ